jgi:uncharacterized RDD family membrane protein YckC
LIVSSNLPEHIDAPFRWKEEPPNPLDRPELYDGLLWRRSLAFFADICLVTAVMLVLWLFNLLTFLIFTALLFMLWAAPIFVIYDTAMIGSNGSATVGMRLLGLEVRTWEGAKPGYLHALISSCLFWFLVPFTGGLILLVAPFSNRRRHVHDMLSGTVVIKSPPAGRARIGNA